MTSVAVATATTPLPRPRAISAPVEIEASNRILVVKRPQDCSGFEAYLWRQAHEAWRTLLLGAHITVMRMCGAVPPAILI